jgi:sugar lactone lactonase YvrE
MSSCAVLVDDENLCGESPVWDERQQKLYWADGPAGNVYCYDWISKRRELILKNFEVSGCALDESGGLIFASSSGVWFWNKRDRPVSIASAVGEAKLQLNDCIADAEGRLLTGSCFYDPSTEYPLGKLFSVQPGGEVRILDEGFHLSNGLGFSPDGNTLYFTDSVARLIYAYAYDSVTGCVRDRRVFVTVDRDSGVPDGLTVDEDGFVWSAEWYGSRISRYDPDGKLERRISVPAKQSSSLIFGGPELRDIFITSAGRSEPMPVMPPGYDAETGYFGGALFHTNVGIQGRLEYRTRFGESHP